LTPDGTRIYVTSVGDRIVSVIDVDPTSPTYSSVLGDPIDVGVAPIGIVAAGKRVYVINVGDDALSVIDADPTSATYNTVVGDPIPLAQAPDGITASPDGLRVYVVNGYYNGGISTIDNNATSPTYGTVIGSFIPVPGHYPTGVAISPDGKRLYANLTIDSPGAHSLVAVLDVDPSSPTYGGVIGHTITVPLFPYGIAASPDGNRLYVTTHQAQSGTPPDTLTVIDTDPSSATYGTVIAGPIPLNAFIARTGVVVSPDGSIAYITDGPDGTLTVVDTKTNAVIGTPITSSNFHPFAQAVSADGTHVYVTNLYDSSVSIISLVPST
jgi:YVTN family beta-propeller protein